MCPGCRLGVQLLAAVDLMVIFFLYVLLCFLVALLGRHKPLGFWWYLVSSLILTPVVGLLMIAAAGGDRARRSDRHLRDR
jgi:UPF0716 family protein affecting phage T7 exclusion